MPGMTGQPGAPETPRRVPLAYLITYHTYGTWLHGDARGSVDRNRNAPDSPRLPRSDSRKRAESSRLRGNPVVLTLDERGAVDRAIRDVCDHRGWTLEEINVRTNHVHVVVRAGLAPEPVMNAFKSWSTRAIRESDPARSRTPMWTRHGSTRYLWDRNDLEGAIRYVRDGQ